MWERDRWTVLASWEAAVFVTARAYRLDRLVLGETEGEGRRARVPRDYQAARKLAIYVAVVAVDCTYAALARIIGMHRDTVTSQWQEVQAAIEADPLLARMAASLERYARNRVLGNLGTTRLQIDADLDRVKSLKTDRLPVKLARYPPDRRGRKRVHPTERPTTFGGVERLHENLIVVNGGPAE
jgi:hypothetical protein